jgi:hypothetical protein
MLRGFLASTFFLANLQLPLFAKESVTFTSGFCFQADSHTLDGDVVSFQVGKGVVQFPKAEIARIDVIPDATAGTSSQSPDNGIPVDQLLSRAAVEAGLEPEFVKSVAKAESAFEQQAVSKKGAQGLMQLMPGTAKELGVDPQIARENVRGGANYLRALLLRYHGDAALALAAYNAGSGAVQKYRGVPPFPETREYIVRVLAEYARLQKQFKRSTAASQAANRQISTPSATN